MIEILGLTLDTEQILVQQIGNVNGNQHNYKTDFVMCMHVERERDK